MRKSVLRAAVRLATEKRRLAFALWIVACAASVAVLATRGLRIDTSRQAMVSEDNEDSRRYQALLREFGTPLHLVVTVEGDDPATNRAYADALAARLRENRDHVGDVLYMADTSAMSSYALLYAPLPELVTLRDHLRATVSALGLTGESTARLEVDGLTGALAKANEALGALEEGDTEGWGSIQGLAGRADAMNDATAAVFRVVREALGTDGWTELQLVKSVGTVDVGAAGIDDHGYLSVRDGRLLFLFVQPSSPSEQVGFLIPFVEGVRRAAEEVRGQPGMGGITVGLTGSPAFVAEEMQQINHDMLVTSLVSLGAVLLLFTLAYRSPLKTVLVFVPLLVGVLVTVALVALLIGRLNLMSSMFLAILVGLGIDFGIHLISRFDEARQAGRDVPDALADTLQGAGPGVVTGALTTIAAFLCMTVSEFTAMRELGVVAGLGVLLVLLATLTLLPCMLAGLAGGQPAPAPASAHLMRRALSSFGRRPGVSLLVVAALTAGLAAAIRPIAFDFDVKELLPPDSPAMKAFRTIEESDFYNPDFAVLIAGSLPEAREWTRTLEAQTDLVARVESIATYLPAEQDAKEPVVREVAALARRFPTLALRPSERPDAARFRAELQQAVEYLEVDVPLTLKMHGLPAMVPGAERLAREARATLEAVATVPDDVLAARLANLEARLARLVAGTEELVHSDRTRVRPDDLPDEVRSQYYRHTEAGERFLVRVFPKGSIADPEFMSRFREALAALYPDVTGYPITFLAFGVLLEEGLIAAGWLALVVIVLILIVDLRSARAVLASLVPLALGVVWMVGGMNLLGIPYNFANLMAIPLLLGIGIDSGVHIVHRWRQGTAPADVAGTAGKAVTLSSLTTMASFGSMVLADHRGMQSLGETLLLGMAACLLLSVVALPALLALVAKGSPRR